MKCICIMCTESIDVHKRLKNCMHKSVCGLIVGTSNPDDNFDPFDQIGKCANQLTKYDS